MKLRTVASLFIALALTACGGHSSSLSSEVSTSSSDSTSSFSSASSESTTSTESSSSTTSSSVIPTHEAYDGYYHDITSWSDGEDLKQKLYDVSRKTYRPLNYTAPNYQTNINADHTYLDFEYLDVIYSEKDVFKGESNKGWQREHAFCASLMCGSLTANAVKRVGRATDFHNLIAADASANSSRGNKNYGVADTTNLNYQNRTTDQGRDGYSFDPVNFEPGDNDKGRVARAIFYMAMMYKNDEVDQINGITMKGLRVVEDPVTYVQGENGAFAIGNLSTLLAWNKNYPVDYLEMQHNISVYKDINDIDGYAQGNRNPFVDYPHLVDYVFGDLKDKAGTIQDCPDTESIFHSESSNVELSHYALKEAKRAYAPGETIADNDYKVVKVLNNYTYEQVTTGYTNSLSEHVFSTDDGESIIATINAGEQRINYRISLNPLASCNSGEITITPDGINKRQKGVEQSVTYNGVDFSLNFETPFDVSSTDMTINNIWSNGSGSTKLGTTFGSKTRVLSKLTIKTKNSYSIDAAYVKAFVGNNESSYQLTIKVGESTIFAGTVNNKDIAKVYGASLNAPVTGQLEYVFSGSSSLSINSIAFNEII